MQATKKKSFNFLTTANLVKEARHQVLAYVTTTLAGTCNRNKRHTTSCLQCNGHLQIMLNKWSSHIQKPKQHLTETCMVTWIKCHYHPSPTSRAAELDNSRPIESVSPDSVSLSPIEFSTLSHAFTPTNLLPQLQVVCYLPSSAAFCDLCPSCRTCSCPLHSRSWSGLRVACCSVHLSLLSSSCLCQIYLYSLDSLVKRYIHATIIITENTCA